MLISSSSFSGMFGSILSPLQEGYVSSIDERSGDLLRPECKGEVGRRGAMYEGVTNLPDESTPGDE
jgi:hypothetical protein